MLYTHLKQGFRLNRTIGFAFVAYGVILLVSLKMQPDALNASIYAWPRLIALAGLIALFLTINETSLRSFKRHPKLDHMTLEKISLLLPMTCCGFVGLAYLATGQLGIFLFSTIVMMQAHSFGHNGIARVMLLLFLLLYAITVPFGYPVMLGFTATSFRMIPGSIQIILMLLPLLWTLAHYGTVVGSLVRTTSTRVSKLQSLAATDGLTGLINRRQFNHQLDAEIARTKRYRNPLSLALFDIDDFKKINDFYGHPTGDRILKELGLLISANVRESDIPARYGGEEFALILPETGQIDSYELLERLRALIEHTVFCLPDNPMTVTISVGVAQLDPEYAKAYDIIEKADAALYEAKKQGKNRVIYGVLTPPKVTYPPFHA